MRGRLSRGVLISESRDLGPGSSRCAVFRISVSGLALPALARPLRAAPGKTVQGARRVPASRADCSARLVRCCVRSVCCDPESWSRREHGRGGGHRRALEVAGGRSRKAAWRRGGFPGDRRLVEARGGARARWPAWRWPPSPAQPIEPRQHETRGPLTRRGCRRRPARARGRPPPRARRPAGGRAGCRGRRARSARAARGWNAARSRAPCARRRRPRED